MKKIKLTLFARIFIYTLLFLCVAIAVFTFFYAKQLEIAFTLHERRQLTFNIQSLLLTLGGKTRAEKIEAISDFGKENKTFAFSIRTNNGEILFETPDFYMNETRLKDLLKNNNIVLEDLRDFDFLFSLSVDDNVTLYVARYARMDAGKEGMFQILPLSLILLALSSAGAFLFARMISRPINRLVRDTVKMSELEIVESPPPRSDEIGLLADNVHSMYMRLKSTIAELENEIRAGRELEEKQRYFFSAASHELKTPIAAITVIMEALIGGLIQAHDYPEYFHKCLHMMNMQTKLVTEILDIVRLNEGRIAPACESLNLSVLIHSLLASCITLAESKNQVIDISLPDDLVCSGDKILLSRVLSNVLMNAVQHTPEGNEIRIYSELSPFLDGEMRIKLSILNTGSRIDEAFIPHIFEPFYRLDKARSNTNGNNGLGLTLVKRALDIMQLPFDIENTHIGVRFWLLLPKGR